MANVGGRLREERERLKLTQEAFANACGISRRAQVTYEADERSPDARYLESAAKFGVDVAYVILGGETDSPRVNPLNTDLLGSVIEQIEETLAQKNKILPAKKKALIISMLYEAGEISGVVDKNIVDNFIALAVA